MQRKRFFGLGIILASLCCLLTCGIEAFYYIDYIPDAYITYGDATSGVVVNLPSSSAEGYGGTNQYFTHFIIFYRIYISGENPTGRIDTAQQMSAINPVLESDFRSISLLTDKTSTTVNTSNLENSFFSRRYYQLTLENGNITSVLGDGSRGRRLEIFFDQNPGQHPVLHLDGGTRYTLQRANNAPGTVFNPEPDRFFRNHEDLYDNGKATTLINADVAGRTSTNPESRYTYVSMYIAAVGQSFETPPRTIYSQPSFLGIFKLTDSF